MTNKLYPVGSIVKIVSSIADRSIAHPARTVALFTGSIDDDRDWSMAHLPINTVGLLILGHKECLVNEVKQIIEYQVLYKDKIYWIGADNVIPTELKKNDK